ncbi:MAG TPA: calcium-binding protein, partial [Pirellulaceae bacterium]|nr:calcium-binding protein [Pirellulaceae bacterium]
GPTGASDPWVADLLDYSAYTTGVSVDLVGAGSSGTATNIFGGLVYDSTGNGIERVIGTALADALLGDDDRNVIVGGAGDDLLRGGGGIDVVDAGAGNDTLRIAGNEAEFDQLSGGDGVDRLVNVGAGPVVFDRLNTALDTLSSGIEQLDGGGYAVTGNSSANTLHLALMQLINVTSVAGGDGNDTVSTSYSNNSGGGAVAYDGGAGTSDAVTIILTPSQLAALSSTELANVQAYVTNPVGATLTATAGPTKGNFTATNFEAATFLVNDDGLLVNVNACLARVVSPGMVIVGTSASDTLAGTSAADLIFGLGGDDRIDGGGGIDCIFGGAGVDALFGNLGDDSLYGGSGDDILHGDAGADQVFGGIGADQLFGDAGTDWLDGNEGDDSLSGGTEADTLAGGPGVDTVRGDAGADRLDVRGNEAEYDLLDGGLDSDDLYIVPGTGDATLNRLSAAASSLARLIGIANPMPMLPPGP